MGFAINTTWLEATMLSSVRIIAFLVIAPPFSHSSVPLRVKAALGMALALVVSPQSGEGYRPLDTAGFFAALAIEVVAGAALGFLVSMAFSAAQGAGHLIDIFGGFQLAQAFDPQSMVNGAQFTRLLHMTALVLLFASDGYQLIIMGLVSSFTAIPVGGGFPLGDAAESMVTGASTMFVAAVQIAGPMILVLFLADAALGLLNRVAPALNAFSLGFPLKILLTLVFAVSVITGLPLIVGALVDVAVASLTGVRS